VSGQLGGWLTDNIAYTSPFSTLPKNGDGSQDIQVTEKREATGPGATLSCFARRGYSVSRGTFNV
jgi:hypothetical protein